MAMLDDLKSLTQDIVKKQNDSLESINKLRHDTEMVNSDISNLVNSLLMVGNKQFAEHKILDDDQIPAGETRSERPQEDELKLSSILMKAFEVLPKEPERIPDEYDDEHGEEPEEIQEEAREVLEEEREEEQGERREEEHENKVEEVHVQRHEVGHQHEHREDRREDYRDVNRDKYQDKDEPEVEVAVVEVEKKLVPHKDTSRPAETHKPPLDRDRVADILKKYSLYDEDDDDDDDDNDDSD